MTDVAVIPARGGSKRIPRKNVALLNGKPLIEYTIEAAKNSGIFSQIIVSTDDEEIADVSVACGAQVVIRPTELSGDYVSSLDVVRHVLESQKLSTGGYCLLQATSPLRNHLHIQDAFGIFEKNRGTSVISACEIEHHPLKTLIRSNDGSYVPIRYLEDLVSPAQILPHAISPNGAIYFSDIQRFLVTGLLFFEDTKYYVMPADVSVDIDTHMDFERVAHYLFNQK